MYVVPYFVCRILVSRTFWLFLEQNPEKCSLESNSTRRHLSLKHKLMHVRWTAANKVQAVDTGGRHTKRWCVVYIEANFCCCWEICIQLFGTYKGVQGFTFIHRLSYSWSIIRGRPLREEPYTPVATSPTCEEHPFRETHTQRLWFWWFAQAVSRWNQLHNYSTVLIPHLIW